MNVRRRKHLAVPAAASLLYIVFSLHAAVIRVPDEITTVQGALDAMQPGDTVLVSIGVYHESLRSPAFPFSLFGDVVSDTGDYPRPILDPSTLPGSDSLLCMLIENCPAATVQDFVYRNGAAMFPRRNSIPGGVRLSNAGMTMRRCKFDSVYSAIARFSGSYCPVSLDRCSFAATKSYCLSPNQAPVHAVNCLFSGDTANLVSISDSSTLIRCSFRDVTAGHLLTSLGGGIEIRECVFGPYGPFPYVPVAMSGFSGEIVDNLFTQCLTGGRQMTIGIPCEGESLRVEGNHFIDNEVVLGQGGAGISIGCDTMAEHTEPVIIVRNNIVEECIANLSAKGLVTWGPPLSAERNRFVRLDPAQDPVVKSYSRSMTLRENIFEDNGFAAEVYRPDDGDNHLDARLNYWGDETGPFHWQSNPLGLGDSVGDSVLFNPWYPDTSFLETPPRTKPSVASYALRAFPNPFNATATLVFEIPEPGIFRIELFDLLGRRVKVLFVGPVAYEKIVRVDGNYLASGIYYARAWQTTHNRPVATTKLVLLK